MKERTSQRKAPMRRRKPRQARRRAPQGRRTWLFVALIVGLSTCGVVYYFRQTRMYCTMHVHPDVCRLLHVLKKIHRSCGIDGFCEPLNSLDFLNVGDFSGDYVGSLRLTRSQSWQGPYLEEPVLYKSRPYAVLVNRKGYYIVPGNGVALDDGSVVGKDIVFDHECDVEELIRECPALSPKGKCLIARIPFEATSHPKNSDATVGNVASDKA